MSDKKATPVPFTGDVDEFNDLMKRYHAANLRLWKEKAALTAQYPDQWVGSTRMAWSLSHLPAWNYLNASMNWVRLAAPSLPASWRPILN